MFLLVRMSLLVFGLLLFSSCGKKTEYKYDAQTQSCKNSSGKPGFNDGEIVECGFIHDQRVRGEKIKGESLRGFKAERVRFVDVNLSESDLTGSLFSECTFSGINFKGANLADAVFENISGYDIEIVYDGFQGTRANLDTILPYSYAGFLEAGGVIDGLDTSSQPAIDGLQMDSTFDQYGKGVLNQDLRTLSQIRIQAPSDSLFAQLFGGTTESAVIEFVKKGAAHLYPNSWGESDQGVAAYNTTRGFLFEQPNWEFSEANLYWNGISNFLRGGTSRLINEELKDKIAHANAWNMNGSRMDLEVDFRGFVHLGPAYLTFLQSSRQRIASLVHEARHSFCDPEEIDIQKHYDLRTRLMKGIRSLKDDLAGLHNQISNGWKTREEVAKIGSDLKAKVESILKEKEIFESEFVKKLIRPNCGYSHDECPADFAASSLRGKAACETVPWGAYAYGAYFAKGLSQYCENCTEKQKQAALALAAENLTRVLNLEKVLTLKPSRRSL